MKTLNKIFAGMLIASVAFGFFGCSDEPEEDENLVVSITTNQNLVTIAAPDEYDGKDVKIIYTTDDTEPSVKLNTAKTDVEVTGDVYSDPFEITETKTIKARGYYFDSESKTFYQGPVATATATFKEITSSTTSTEATGDSTGTFTFNLASTGNSNTVHYFDTSASNVFKLNDTYPNAYYQTQFSWKGSGKGNWYLYMRDVNKGLVKEGGVTSFVAKGTYTGNCFNASNGSVANGDLELFDSDGVDRGSITISDQKQFTMKVTNSATNSVTSSSVSVGDAK